MSTIRDPFAKKAECPVSQKNVVLSGERLILEGRVLGMSGRLKCSNQVACHISRENPSPGSGCLLYELINE